MSNSPLVNFTKISPNKNSPRNHAIDTITIHCVVGQCTVEALGNLFANPSRSASSNYGVGYDGRIGLYVDEADRSWCSSSGANDNRAITIEVASDTTEPYAVTDKAYEALIKLVADICKRNNIEKLVWSFNKADRVNHTNGCNMTCHRDFASTQCPGTYLYNHEADIAQRVNKLLEEEKEEFKIGDIVYFKGDKHYVSSNADTGYDARAGEAKIFLIANGKHPYSLIHTEDSQSNVYGWVDAGTFTKEKAELKVGDHIKLTSNVQYNGVQIRQDYLNGFDLVISKIDNKGVWIKRKGKLWVEVIMKPQDVKKV